MESKIEITLTDENYSKNEEIDRTDISNRSLQMKVEQYNQKSFLYYTYSEGNFNESSHEGNLTDRIKKIDINKTTPISLKELFCIFQLYLSSRSIYFLCLKICQIDDIFRIISRDNHLVL